MGRMFGAALILGLVLVACGAKKSPSSSADASTGPFSEQEWKDFCDRTHAFGAKCTDGGAPSDCQALRACGEKMMSPAALRAISSCTAHAACDADCYAEADKLTTSSTSAEAFLAACKKAATSTCASLAAEGTCETMAEKLHAKLLAPAFIDPMTACFSKADCAGLQTCMDGVSSSPELAACHGQDPSGASASNDGDLHAAPVDPAPSLVGAPLPAFKGTILGSKKTLSSMSLAGKVAIIHFWASWAGPCKVSLPQLQKIADKNKKDVVVVGISVDDEPVGPAKFLAANKIKFASIFDEDKAASQACSVGTMPETLIVDKKGIIRFEHPGYHEEDPALYAKEVKSLQ